MRHTVVDRFVIGRIAERHFCFLYNELYGHAAGVIRNALVKAHGDQVSSRLSANLVGIRDNEREVSALVLRIGYRRGNSFILDQSVVDVYEIAYLYRVGNVLLIHAEEIAGRIRMIIFIVFCHHLVASGRNETYYRIKLRIRTYGKIRFREVTALSVGYYKLETAVIYLASRGKADVTEIHRGNTFAVTYGFRGQNAAAVSKRCLDYEVSVEYISDVIDVGGKHFRVNVIFPGFDGSVHVDTDVTSAVDYDDGIRGIERGGFAVIHVLQIGGNDLISDHYASGGRDVLSTVDARYDVGMSFAVAVVGGNIRPFRKIDDYFALIDCKRNGDIVYRKISRYERFGRREFAIDGSRAALRHVAEIALGYNESIVAFSEYEAVRNDFALESRRRKRVAVRNVGQSDAAEIGGSANDVNIHDVIVSREIGIGDELSVIVVFARLP